VKKILAIIATTFALLQTTQAQPQQDTMFIHRGQTIFEFAIENVDSIVPVLGATADLDELRIYKDGEMCETFLINEIDSIIFYRVDVFANGVLDFGTGSILYNFHSPMVNLPVRLHYHIPRGGDPTTMPILFSMHGNGRNAVGQINAWRDFADHFQVMVFAPEFSTQFFPGNIQYHRGWVSSSGTSWVPRPDSLWSFTLIEHMFDFILEQTGSKETRYDIVGHSAGSQFVHRMMFFLPDARIRTGIASNAGFYMMPTLTGEYGGGTFNFPYSLGGTGTTFNEVDLEAYFGRRLIIHLGMGDTVQDGDVSTTPGANAQGEGPSRLSRGHFFYNFAKQTAKTMGVPFNWILVEVPGVAHNAQRMIQAPNVGSAALLFTNPSQSINQKSKIKKSELCSSPEQ